MKKILFSLVAMIMFGIFTSAIQAEILWLEDFSDVNDWMVISDPGEGSTITISDNLGAMYIDKDTNVAAFTPVQTETNFIPFDLTKKSKYIIEWKVDHLTDSVSWDIAIDEFDADKQYINTIWNIYPSAGNIAEKGKFSKSLGSKTWNVKTAYIIPKVTIHTGNAKQTVYFTYIKVTKKR